MRSGNSAPRINQGAQDGRDRNRVRRQQRSTTEEERGEAFDPQFISHPTNFGFL
jgi:hypothetical protein